MSEAIDIYLLNETVNRILSRRYGRTVKVKIGSASEKDESAASAETDKGRESG